jgi:hypothetical protein
LIGWQEGEVLGFLCTAVDGHYASLQVSASFWGELCSAQGILSLGCQKIFSWTS